MSLRLPHSTSTSPVSTETTFTPPGLWVRASQDGCPQCLERYNEPNLMVADLRGHRMRAFYDCPNCGHQWHTAWVLEVLEAAA